jgi:predicted nucleic acid-binding Zn ribbon protein
MKDKFEERLSNLKKTYKLTDEEKKLIMEYILKRERKFSFIYLIPVFILLILVIYLLPHQISFLTPNFILDENESIKRIETYIELYLSNPLFLTQIIYYLLLSITVIFGFIFIKLRFNIKGGR